MNLQCPNCQKMLNIEDKFAGQVMQCPLCSGTFTAPVLPGAPTSAVPLASAVAPKSNPPAEDVFSLASSSAPFSPPPTRESKSEGPADSATPVANAPGSDHPVADASVSDYPHRYIIWISPRVVPWIAPVALVLVFFFLFFPWVRIPTEGSAELASQSGWGRLFSSMLFLFYFLVYVVALSLSITWLLLTLGIVPTHPQIAHVLPWGSCSVAGAVAFAFLFLYIGFLGEQLSTAWFRWAVWLHLLALIGLALEFWLQRRGSNRPMPRIDVFW